MPNSSSMCSTFYLIIICVFVVFSLLLFASLLFWSCDACVQSDRCLDIPWNLTRWCYWTCTLQRNRVLSSHCWVELRVKFDVVSTVYYIIYVYVSFALKFVLSALLYTIYIADWIFMKLVGNMLIYIFRFELHMKFCRGTKFDYLPLLMRVIY